MCGPSRTRARTRRGSRRSGPARNGRSRSSPPPPRPATGAEMTAAGADRASSCWIWPRSCSMVRSRACSSARLCSSPFFAVARSRSIALSFCASWARWSSSDFFCCSAKRFSFLIYGRARGEHLRLPAEGRVVARGRARRTHRVDELGYILLAAGPNARARTSGAHRTAGLASMPAELRHPCRRNPAASATDVVESG